jgi:ribosomal protein S18 acetylase RimI-like enzyme
MHLTNETSLPQCRFLTAKQVELIHQTFVAAFADYTVKFELTERQFQNHVTLNAVDLNRSAGCFEGERLVGLSLNGFGSWEGKDTIYDAGTAVLPEYRRRGVSRAMFEWMMPIFADRGYKQFLLEVISHNEPAVRLYERLGFRTTRELLLLESDSLTGREHPAPNGIEIREIHRHESVPFALFWEGKPSWQNSLEAIERSLQMKRLFGAYEGEKCVGYIIFSGGVGRLAQLAVDRDYRRQGIASRLLVEMQKDAAGHQLQVINLDESITEAVVFFQNRGFKRTLTQFEMVREL